MRYFFNIRDGNHLSPDREGSEHSDAIQAKYEARALARDLLIDHLKAGRELDGREIEIADESGKVVETIKVREVLQTH